MSDQVVVRHAPEEAEPPLIKRLLAELIGTFFLVVAALLSPPQLTFALVGAVLLIMVVVIGKVSGSHINPAVTVGLMSVRQIAVGTGRSTSSRSLSGRLRRSAWGASWTAICRRPTPRSTPCGLRCWAFLF